MRTGIKTSEFYITVLALAAGFISATLFDVGGGEIGAFMSPAIAYIGGRSYVKKLQGGNNV